MLHPDDAGGQQKQHNAPPQPQSRRQQQHQNEHEVIEELDSESISANIPPGARSPHPYRRQSLDIHDRIFVTNLAARERQLPFASNDNRSFTTILQQRSSSISSNAFSETTPRRRRLSRRESEISEASSGLRDGTEARWGLTASPSDSGTEADDERVTTYLRGLPLAAGKLRKGLKDESGTATPSDFDGVKKKLLLDDNIDRLIQKARAEDTKGRRQDGDAAVEARTSEYRWRWRGELLRRVLEHVFLCGLTHACLEERWDRLAQWPHSYDLSKVRNDPVEKAKWLVAAILLAYLVHAFWMWTQYIRAMWGLGSITIAKVPSPGDPGSVLYPLLVPLAVASAGNMTSSKPAIILLNLVLSACAYPISAHSSSLANLQWATIIFLVLPHNVNYATRMPFYEDLTFLLPLHGSLVATIRHLCSTSLLSAEAQLLSVGLINLLFFAQSPQALILFALLWIGGLLMLVGCRQFMRWSITLARIPGWRFRSPRHAQARISPANQPPRSAIGTLLRTSSLFTSEPSRDSSDDREWTKEEHVPLRKVNTSDESSRRKDLNSRSTEKARDGQSRRHTLPTIIHTEADGSSPRKIEGPQQKQTRAKKKSKAKNKPWLWLTRTQATVVKWLLAFYVYLFALTAILLPIRWYIQERALHGNEPVGWALSYLLGEISAFRLWVIMTDLDSWIILPPRLPELVLPLPTTSVFGFAVPTLSSLRLNLVGTANTRLVIIAWCVGVLTMGLVLVARLKSVMEVDTRRKVFHGMMVLMFLPTVFADPCFTALALVLMLAIFLLLDLFRAAQLPPISRPLTHFLAPYVDGRDHKGPVIVSPIFLLIGCAIPLWLSLAGAHYTDPLTISGTNSTPLDQEHTTTSLAPYHPWKGWEIQGREVAMVTGIVCVGMGDAAASLIGRRYGRRRWIWSGGKSLEGSAAFVVAVAVGLLAAKAWMHLGGWNERSSDVASNGASSSSDGSVLSYIVLVVGKTLLAGMGASFTEAVLTAGNDNVIVPVVLWLLVRCLRI